MRMETKRGRAPAAAACALGTLIGLTAALLPLRGGQAASRGGTAAESARTTGFVVLPIVYYTPETRWAGGVGGLLTLRGPRAAATDRPSSLFFAAVITQNRQFAFNAQPELYLAGESLLIAGRVEAARFPNAFFGIGRDTPASGREDYTPRLLSVQADVLARLAAGPNVYGGPVFVLDHTEFLSFDPGGRLSTGTIPGSRGGAAAGLGLALKLDGRDNVFFPTSGLFHQLSAVAYGFSLGSDYEFLKVKADLRAYVPIRGTHVLAFQGLLQGVTGGAPFTAMPGMGGENLMRGCFGGRFRDSVLAAVQAEYRLPLAGRFGLAAFAGAADVAGRPDKLSPGSAKISGGLGLRFRIAPAEGANIRVDFGWARGSRGIYFTAGEAF